MKKILLILVLAVMFSGCSTSSKFNALNLGMSKAEVINTLGKPYFTSAREGREVLNYKYYGDPDTGVVRTSLYSVVLEEGKVTAYGKGEK